MIEAQYRDVTHAIRWAQRVLGGLICKTSSLGSWRGKETSGSTLSPQEQHGQAIQIFRALEVLSPDERSFVEVRYLPRWMDRPPRSTSRMRQIADEHGGARASHGPPNKDRNRAVDALAAHCMRAAGQRGAMQAYRLLVDQYFSGKDKSYRVVRKLLKVRDVQALHVRREAFRALERLEIQAESRLHYALMTAGFVPGAVERVR